MTIKSFWNLITKLKVAKVSNSLSVVANYFFRQLPPPPRAPSPPPSPPPLPAQHSPPPPSPPGSQPPSSPLPPLTDDEDEEVPRQPPPAPAPSPVHFVLEVVPIEVAERRAMKADTQIRSLPRSRQERLLRTRTFLGMRSREDQLGEKFPGAFVTWIFEGASTQGKEGTLGVRAQRDVEVQTRRERRARDQDRQRYRQQIKRYKKREKKKAKARESTFEGSRDDKATQLPQGGARREEDEIFDQTQAHLKKLEESIHASSSKGSATPFTSRDLPHVKAPGTVDYDELFDAQCQFLVIPPSRIRYVQARGEAEHVLREASRSDPRSERVEYVSYASGIDSGDEFHRSPSHTVCGSVDGDQIALITEQEYGWTLHQTRFGRKNYLLQQINPSDDPNDPRPYPLPDDEKKLIPSWRLMNLSNLFLNTSIFPSPSIFCRAAITAIIGNDYFVGGSRITFRTFTQGAHPEFVSFISQEDLGTQYETANAEQRQQLEARFNTLKSALPQSPPITSLTLSEFIRNRQTTLAHGIEYINKSEVLDQYLQDYKNRLDHQLEEKKDLVERQTQTLFGFEAHRRNHLYIPSRHWSRQQARSTQPQKKWATFEDDSEAGVRFQHRQRPLPFKRRSLPDFHQQLESAIRKIKVEHIPPPDKQPVEHENYDQKSYGNLQDLGVRWLTIRHRPSVYRELVISGRPKKGRAQQTAIKSSFVRLEQAITQVAAAEAGAIGRAWFLTLDLVGAKSPHLFMDLDLDHHHLTNKLLSLAAIRVSNNSKDTVDAEGDGGGTGDGGDVAHEPSTRRTLRSAKDPQDDARQEPEAPGGDRPPPVPSANRPISWPDLCRQAALQDEHNTQEIHSSRNVTARLRPTLSTLATNSMVTWRERTKELEPLNLLAKAILDDPNQVIGRINSLTRAVFPRLIFVDLSLLSPASVALFSSLSSDSNLVESLVDYISCGHITAWSDGHSKTTLTAQKPVPVQLQHRFKAAITDQRRNLRSLTRIELDKVSINSRDVQEAWSRLEPLLRHLSVLLPAVLVDFAGAHVSRLYRADRGAQPTVKQVTNDIHAQNFLPLKYSFRTLLHAKGGGNRSRNYFEVAHGTKLVVLFLGNNLRHSFDPSAVHFQTGTTYQYSHIPLRREKGEISSKIRPAIFTSLRDHLHNQVKSFDRSKELQDERSKAVDAYHDDGAWVAERGEQEGEEENVAPSEETQAESFRNSPHFASDRYRPSEIVKRRLQRSVKAARRVIEGRDGYPVKNPRTFSLLKGLSPLDRISAFHLLHDDLEVPESLLKNPYLAPRINDENGDVVDEKGLGAWEINVNLLYQDLERVNRYYETILPDLIPRHRFDHLTNLKAEVLTQRFNVARPGVYVPNGYTITEQSVNILYQDPRRLVSLPDAYSQPDCTNSYIEPTEKSVYNKQAYGALQRDVIKEVVKEVVSSQSPVVNLEEEEEEREGTALEETHGDRAREGPSVPDPPSSETSEKKKKKKNKFKYVERPAPHFLDEHLQWTAARRRPNLGPPTTIDSRRGYVIAPDYYDPDYPNSSLKQTSFKNEKERQEYEETIAFNLDLLRYRLFGPLPFNHVRVVIANDAGQACPCASCIYFPEAKEAYTDLVTRSRFVSAAKTRQKVGEEIRSQDGSKERDEAFRSLNTKPLFASQQDGASKSIKEWNSAHPDRFVSPSLGKPSFFASTVTHEQKLFDQAEMDSLASIQVATLVTDPTKVYEVNLVLGVEKLPKFGVVGPEKYSKYEKALVNALVAHPQVRLKIFQTSENFTSQHDPRCDHPTIFHPVSLENDNTIHRSSACYTCRELGHRDLLSAQAQVIGLYLTALTNTYAYSPDHEVSTFGRDIDVRGDKKRLRLRGSEQEKVRKLQAELWEVDQQAGIDPQYEAEAQVRRQQIRNRLETVEEELDEPVLSLEEENAARDNDQLSRPAPARLLPRLTSSERTQVERERSSNPLYTNDPLDSDPDEVLDSHDDGDRPADAMSDDSNSGRIDDEVQREENDVDMAI